MPEEPERITLPSTPASVRSSVEFSNANSVFAPMFHCPDALTAVPEKVTDAFSRVTRAPWYKDMPSRRAASSTVTVLPMPRSARSSVGIPFPAFSTKPMRPEILFSSIPSPMRTAPPPVTVTRRGTSPSEVREYNPPDGASSSCPTYRLRPSATCHSWSAATRSWATPKSAE